MDINALERLNNLKEKGILSQEEFEAEKQKLLTPQKTETTPKESSQADKPIYKYFKECLFTSKYYSIKGRARRKEYWGFILNTLLINLFFSLTSSIPAALILGFIINIYMFIPNITVTIRRLHDTNHSGWWFGSILFLTGFGMILAAIGAIVNYSNYNAPIFTHIKTIIFLLLPFIMFIIGLITFIFTLFKSTPKENKYGIVPEGVKFQ